jgi:hypothetical protein
MTSKGHPSGNAVLCSGIVSVREPAELPSRPYDVSALHDTVGTIGKLPRGVDSARGAHLGYAGLDAIVAGWMNWE